MSVTCKFTLSSLPWIGLKRWAQILPQAPHNEVLNGNGYPNGNDNRQMVMPLSVVMPVANIFGGVLLGEVFVGVDLVWSAGVEGVVVGFRVAYVWKGKWYV